MSFANLPKRTCRLLANAAGRIVRVAVGLGSDERILLGRRGGRALQLKIQRAHEAVGRKTLVCDDLDLRRIAERRADGPVVTMQILEAYNHGVRFSKNRGCEASDCSVAVRCCACV